MNSNFSRQASFDIGAYDFRVQDSYLSQNHSELETYYQKLLALRTSSGLAISRVTLNIPIADLQCERFSEGTYTCTGESSRAYIAVVGSYTFSSSTVNISPANAVSVKLIAANTNLVPDLVSDIPANKIQTETRAEVTFADGKKMFLVWSPYFSAAQDPALTSYCTGQ